jgi:hypothetical protein
MAYPCLYLWLASGSPRGPLAAEALINECGVDVTAITILKGPGTEVIRARRLVLQGTSHGLLQGDCDVVPNKSKGDLSK